MLTFESSSVLGAGAIVEKLSVRLPVPRPANAAPSSLSNTPQGLPFQQVKHQVSTKDAQPTSNDGVIVLVTGQLLVDEEQRPMNFSQTFHLAKDANGYFVYNDIFKLIFG